MRATYILLFMLTSLLAASFAQQSIEVHIYCFPESTSQSLLSYFANKSGWKVVLHSLNDSSSSQRFLNITRTLMISGVEVMPLGTCLPCQMQYLTWDDLLITYGSPLAGFFHDGKLTAITIGITDNKTLDQVILVNDRDVKVFTLYDAEVRPLEDPDVRTRLEEAFVGKEESKTTEVNNLGLISSVTLLALADSVNPCTFAVFTALLLTSLYYFSKRSAVAAGLSFILAVYVGYFMLGLGLFRVLAAVAGVSKVIGVLGLIIGGLGIVQGLRPKFKAPLPKYFRRFMKSQMNKSYASPIASFLLGLVASFTLLPCSGGPYVVCLGLLSTLNEPGLAYILLALYNAIFVAPLAAILIVVAASSSYVSKVKVFRSTRLGFMELLSSSLLIIVCMYLLIP